MSQVVATNGKLLMASVIPAGNRRSARAVSRNFQAGAFSSKNSIFAREAILFLLGGLAGS